MKEMDSLFFIPCCSRKRSRGKYPIWNKIKADHDKNSFFILDEARGQMINFYSNLSKEEAWRCYRRYDKEPEKRKKKRGKAWKKNLQIPKCKTIEAINRYIGNLYSSLDSDIINQLGDGEIDNILIVSAMFGIIAPTDMIPDYELIMMDKSPNIRPVWEFWRETFAIAGVKKTLQNFLSKFDHLYCLMSTTTGYIDAIADLIAEYDSYYIRSLEKGQSNKLAGWGNVLNEVIRNELISPIEIEELSKRYNCELKKLLPSETRRFRRSSIDFDPKNKFLFGMVQNNKVGVRMSQADAIRDFICKGYIQPARKKGKKRIKITAGEIGRRMRLSDRMPNICQVLGGRKLEDLCGIQRIERLGGVGPRTFFTYEILETPIQAEEERKELTPLETPESEENIPVLFKKLYELYTAELITKEELKKKTIKLLEEKI